MTAVDHTITRPGPVVSHRRRKLVQLLAKPGWVIMLILSLVNIAFVALYLAFDFQIPTFRSNGRCTSSANSCSAYTCSPACSPLRPVHSNS